MKKTLFLSAILGAALCSSAFGAVNTQTLSSATVTVNGYAVTQTAGTVNLVTTTSTSQEQMDLPSGLGEAAVTVLGGANARFKIKDASLLSGCGTVVLGTASVSGQESTSTVNGGQLFIDAANTSGVAITNNLVLGATTYWERNNYDTALRMHESGAEKKIVLSGSMTLADNSSISVTNDHNYIEGNISGAGKTLTLTQGGTLRLSGGATLGALATGNVSLNLDATKSDGTTAAASKTYAIGTLTSNKTLTLGDGVQVNLSSGDSSVLSVSGNNGTISVAEGATFTATAQDFGTHKVTGAGNITFTGSTNPSNPNKGAHGHIISADSNFTGTLTLAGRYELYSSNFGNAAKVVLVGDRDTNRTGFWAGNYASSLSRDLEITGDYCVEFYGDKNITLDGTVTGNHLSLTNGGTVYFNQAVNLKQLEVSNTAIFAAGKEHSLGVISGSGAVTLKGIVNVANENTTDVEHVREIGNGFGTITKTATLVTGTNNVTTTDVTGWKLNGNSTDAMYDNGSVSALFTSHLYYINDSAADAVINDDAQLVAGEYTISGRVLVGTEGAAAGSGVTLTLNGDTSLHSTNLVDVYHNSTVVLNDNASLNATTTGAGNMLWMHNGSKVQMADNATLIVDDYTLQGGTVTARGDAQLGGNGNQASNATITGSAITVTGDKLNAHAISGGSVTVQDDLTTEIASTLSGSTDLVIGSGATARVSHTGDNFNVNNITLGDGATMKLENSRWNLASNTTITLSGDASVTSTTAYAWLNSKTLTLTGNGSVTLKGFLSGVSGNTSNQGNLNIGAGSKLTITGTAQDNATDGFIIWNGAAHTYSINGTLVIENGIRAQKEGNASATAASATFNVGSAGLLQLNQGITFFTTASGLTSLGTINVQGAHGVGGTLAIGGQTTGNMATVNLQDGSKVVAIDAATSTEQVFTLNNQATVTFSGKGLDGTANNTLTVNSDISNSTAAVNSVGAVNFGDMNVVRLEVTGTTTVGTLETQKVIMHEDSSLTIAGADTNITTLTLGSGSTVTLGSADEGGHNFDLTTSTLTVNGDSTLNANLVVESGTLNFAAGAVLTMGCEVTISGSSVYVTIDGTFDDFMAYVRGGNDLLLIDGLEEGDADAQALTLNTVYINGQTNSELHLALVENTFTENGTYAIVVAPEPATATLSLLALAALCARRKRH